MAVTMRCALAFVALAALPLLCLAAGSSESAPKLDPDGVPNHYVQVDVAKITRGTADSEVKGASGPPVARVEQKWDELEKKAASMRAATDKLAAAMRVLKSLRAKKKQADDEFVKEAHRYAHTGGHPTDHTKDAKMPLKLEVATAQKNVIDLRFSRAQAQAELLRRVAVDIGAISNTTAAQVENPDPTAAAQTKQDSKKAERKEKEALEEYKQFKKHALKAKVLQKKLQSQKAPAREAQGAKRAKAQEQQVKPESAAVKAHPPQKQQGAALESKQTQQHTQQDRKVQQLKTQLKQAHAATQAETKRADQATTALKTLQTVEKDDAALKRKLKSVKP